MKTTIVSWLKFLKYLYVNMYSVLMQNWKSGILNIWGIRLLVHSNLYVLRGIYSLLLKLNYFYQWTWLGRLKGILKKQEFDTIVCVHEIISHPRIIMKISNCQLMISLPPEKLKCHSCVLTIPLQWPRNLRLYHDAFVYKTWLPIIPLVTQRFHVFLSEQKPDGAAVLLQWMITNITYIETLYTCKWAVIHQIIRNKKV